MKRISFKDSGGLNLTQAVLSGRKTMTRRAVPEQVERDAMVYAEGKSEFTRVKFEYVLKHSPYKVGDVVAIQQAYKEGCRELFGEAITQTALKRTAGWTNKMFVAASMMPHHIRITNIRVERLQDISDEDCLREGVLPIWDNETEPRKIDCYDFTGSDYVYKTARTAEEVHRQCCGGEYGLRVVSGTCRGIKPTNRNYGTIAKMLRL